MKPLLKKRKARMKQRQVDELRPLLPGKLPPAPDAAGGVFVSFVKNSGLVWQQLFAGATREQFKNLSQLPAAQRNDLAFDLFHRHASCSSLISSPLFFSSLDFVRHFAP
jgi:hypothetical protein